MKANELIIGDFVFHETYGNAIIETIDNDFGDNPSVKLISENIKHKDGYKYGYCWCDLNEIFPIPLTPEILEKNGFKECNGEQWSLYKYKDDDYTKQSLYQVLWSKNEQYLEIDSYTSQTGEYNRMGVLFVHELQHTLKLCGIEKEIEL